MVSDSGKEKKSGGDQTDLAKKLIGVLVMVADAVNELVEEVNKVADVDAAHGVGLREGHCKREGLTS